MNFKAYGLKNLPSSNIDVNGLYFIKPDGEEEFKIYIRKADNSAWVGLGTTSAITSVNGLTGSSVQLDLDFSNGVLSLTGSNASINLDARYVGANDDIAWSRITGRPTTLSGYGITDAAKDNEVVKLTGNQSIAGNKTFSSAVTVGAASSANHAIRKVQMDTAVSNLQNQIDNISGTVSSGLSYKGEIDASSNPNYPDADKGDMWIISEAGRIGGSSGMQVDVGNTLICKEDNTTSGTQSQVGDKWTVLQADLDQATETKPGFAKIATQAIVDAGTNDEDIVTAKKLRSVLDDVVDNMADNANSRYVRFDASQTLDDTQKGQARENINAASDSDVVKLTGAQSVAGVKTFTSKPRIPNATANNEAVAFGQMNTITEGKFVRFDASQSLSSANKNNARNNIDAASVEDVQWAAKEW